LLAPFKNRVRVYLINALNMERIQLMLSIVFVLKFKYVNDNSEGGTIPGLTCCTGIPLF